MAYPTDAQVKSWQAITGSADDAQITIVNNAAKSFVERHCNRTFEASASATAKSYPARKPYLSKDGRRLTLFQEFATTTSLAVTNGDGIAFTVATELEVVPVDAPYYQLYCKPISGKVFYSVGDVPIIVTAKWGFATTIPDAIFSAIIEIAVLLYRARQSGGLAGMATQSGVFVQGVELPKAVVEILDSYRRYT